MAEITNRCKASRYDRVLRSGLSSEGPIGDVRGYDKDRGLMPSKEGRCPSSYGYSIGTVKAGRLMM